MLHSFLGLRNVEILRYFRRPVGKNVVQYQRYVEYNHSVSLNEDLICVPNGGGSVWCLIEELYPFCSLLVLLEHIVAQNVTTEEKPEVH